MKKVLCTILFILCFAVGCATNHNQTQDPYDVIYDNEQQLKKVRVGVIENRYRRNWDTSSDYKANSQRTDEGRMFASYARDLGIFKEVVLVNSPYAKEVDYVISFDVEGIYSVEKSWVWTLTFSLLTLGIIPDSNSSALYVGQAAVYDATGKEPMIVSGSISENYRSWNWDNWYWNPSVYTEAAYYPLFEQLLYDFIAKSGCLSLE